MTSLLGVNFDANGTIQTAVLTTDDNFEAHKQQGCTLAIVPVATAGLLHDLHELKKACIPAISIVDKNLAAKCQADCDVIDTQRLADTKAIIDSQAAALAEWNALPDIVKQALITADTALGQIVSL